MKRRLVFVVALLFLLAATPVLADVVDESDNWRIRDTSIHLFDSTQPALWQQNNWSPVDYSGIEPPYVPSPGKWDYDVSEHSDLEGLFYQYDAANGYLRIWLVTSMGPQGYDPYTDNTAYTKRETYYLGDVFLDKPGTATEWDYALLSWGAYPGAAGQPYTYAGSPGWDDTNRSQGALVSVTASNFYEINGSYSYQGRVEEAEVNPWAVTGLTAGQVLTVGTFDWEEVAATADAASGIDYADEVMHAPAGYDLAGTPDVAADRLRHDTYVYVWEVTSDALKNWSGIGFHVTIQCGNDLIEQGTELSMGSGAPIPVPGAIGLGFVGLGLVGVVTAARRRRR